jgi:hypothetical protein
MATSNLFPPQDMVICFVYCFPQKKIFGFVSPFFGQQATKICPNKTLVMVQIN